MSAKPTERRTINVDGVFDIETEKWDRFVVGGCYSPTRGFRYWTYRREMDMVEHLLTEGGDWWAHNGGRFDALWFLGHVVRMGLKVEVKAAGQRIIALKVESLTIRDSAALVPLPLSIAALIGGLAKSETNLPCSCEIACGGYCSISRSMTAPLMKRLVAYLETDCRGDYAMLERLTVFAADNDLDLGATIGGSAWRTALRWSEGVEKANWENDRVQAGTLYAFAREAYYGGRTQVFRPSAERGFRYDINSAYPAALRSLDLPTGSRREAFNRDALRAWLDGKPGLFRARVSVPRMHIPPLPVRTKHRIAYPVGEFVGCWSSHELRYAVSVGARVLAVNHSLVWDDSAPLLRGFCERIWQLRDLHGVKSPLGQWLKWYANSLTGKLAQRPETEHVVCNPPERPPGCPARFDCGGLHHKGQGKCCRHKCTGACGRAVPLDLDQRIWSRVVWRLPDCGHVEWAAFLTSWARTTLHAQLVDDGQEGATAVYCDTDSVVCTHKRVHNIGPELGAFKFEGRFAPAEDEFGEMQPGFTSYAPKTYRLYDPDEGKWIAKAKGIPDAARVFHMLGGRFGGVTIDRGVETFKTAARGEQFFRRKDMFRRINADGVHFGDRVLGADFLTHPQDAITFA